MAHTASAYLERRSAEQWWNALDHIFERALAAVGLNALQAQCSAKEVRHAYANSTHWRLTTLFVLSNHVPELRSLIKHLELESRIAKVFNSAETGYEKPHPQAFQNILNVVCTTAVVWMIGDNMTADIKGAKNAGIPAILVRKHHEEAEYSCEKLWEIAAIINQTS